MSAQPTPGPWEVSDLATGQLITKDVPPMIGQPIPIGRIYSPNMHADARLIAAAPELLAASRNALETLAPWKNDDFVWAAMSQLIAAIAKATGGAAA